MLKKIRLTLAIISFASITFLFLDFTGTLHGWLGWLAKIQFLPALLAFNAGVFAVLIVLTLLFGRIYCSVICPLGVFQDMTARSSRKLNKKKRYAFSPAISWLRYTMLAVCIAAFILGAGSLVALLDPYGVYGRIANNLLLPVYQWVNNLFADVAERMDSYAFYSTEVWIKSGVTFAIALATLFIVGFLAWRNGRTYCNTVCPAGTILGFISRFSWFRVTFDTEKCTNCHLCERNCKASCIDSKKMTIDRSRCVACFNCIERCRFGAMRYAPRQWGVKETAKTEIIASMKYASLPCRKRKTLRTNVVASGRTTGRRGLSRLDFLSIAGFFALANTLKAQQQLQADGGLADIADKKTPDREAAIVPPGAQGIKYFGSHCTGCQLCVSVCPNQILRPSDKLMTLMQPEMSYERGYCRPECVECSNVCPTGAIKPMTAADKTAVSIGRAVWLKEKCIVHTDEKSCTACEWHCPTKAILFIPIEPDKKDSLKIPTVQQDLCIGCGACEYYCSARPFSAIYVEGNIRHHSV
jgi:polyferredoxin